MYPITPDQILGKSILFCENLSGPLYVKISLGIGFHMRQTDINVFFQVNEIINISQPLREQYKLSMTDGVQQIFDMD